MLIVLKYVLILWGIIALAWLGAWRLKQRGAAEPGQFTSIVVFVGFLFGFRSPRSRYLRPIITTMPVLRLKQSLRAW